MKRRASGVAAAAVCAVLLLPAPTAAHPTRAAGDPGRFLIESIEAKWAGRYGEAWRMLYPLHQRLVPRYEYVACERLMPLPGRLESVDVVRESDGFVRVAGVAGPVRATAVTLRAVLRVPGDRDPVVIVHTFHAVPVGGRWTWILSADRFALYRGPGCGIHVPA
jgi:hypothetical protein